MELNSVIKLCRRRELQECATIGFQRGLHVTDNLIERIGLEVELKGHAGCVNCLEWNEQGNLLASGSDDQQVIIWDPFRHKKLQTVQTGHHGNIFSVKFLPNSNDATIASAAADCKIRVHDLTSKETTHVCGCHLGRVKRLATIPNVPFMFWSAAEDGMIMQFDLRTPHSCASLCSNVLINLVNHIGNDAEAKCLAINPLRPELLAVGANDPYVRLYDRRMITPTAPSASNHSRSLWDRQNSTNILAGEKGCNDNLPFGCVQYFVAGHLPLKLLDYKKRYRALASTYLTFSPDGSELLVNLGGEQIYLFDINRRMPIKKFGFQEFDLFSSESKEASYGYGSHRNGTTVPNGVTNGITKPFCSSNSSSNGNEIKEVSKKKPRGIKLLPTKAEILKQKANAQFDKQQYSLAINLYNKALQVAPNAAVLYGNRAVGFMKRAWDGDLYAALRDCIHALLLDPDHLKAHFRLARCLFELRWTKEADECLQQFKITFPEHARSHACEALDRDIKAALFARNRGSDDGGLDGSSGASGGRQNRKGLISEQEKVWRSNAYDYETRFCGHCNTTTDIKEANFFGSNSQYVIAGSDDGSFFVWDRWTTNMVRVLKGDDAIVNCLQPHPDFCLLATSGIDPVVRLWSPQPQDGRRDDREVTNSDDAALANQKRMNADPLEMVLRNMGYRIRNVLETDDDSEGPESSEVQSTLLTAADLLR